MPKLNIMVGYRCTKGKHLMCADPAYCKCACMICFAARDLLGDSKRPEGSE